jgi:hypothetical protein
MGTYVNTQRKWMGGCEKNVRGWEKGEGNAKVEANGAVPQFCEAGFDHGHVRDRETDNQV